MLDTFEVDTDLEVRFRQYWLATFFLCIPPLLAIDQGPRWLAGDLSMGETLGLLIGLLLPALGAYYFFEFGRFTFSRRDNIFRWRWRNLLRKDSGEVALDRIVKIRRDALEASDLHSWNNSYRLIAILDNGQIVPLTRSYSAQHGKKLDQIVDQLRDYLGHFVAIS